MKAAPSLTDRQRKILDAVSDSIASIGAPPTRAELAKLVGYRSPNAADEQLRVLQRKGFVDIVSGASRGIRLKPGLTRAPVPTSARESSTPAATIPLPLIGRVDAGYPILAEEHVERTVAMAAGLFAVRPDCLLRAPDMSMRDAGIITGDLLAVQLCSGAQEGNIVVARRRHAVLVRRLLRTSSGHALIPANPEFAHIDVAAVMLEGIVVGVVRSDFEL